MLLGRKTPITKLICLWKFNNFIQYSFLTVVVCTDLSGKEPGTHVGVSSMVTSGSLNVVMVMTLACNVKYMGLILALGIIFFIIITP